MRHTGGVPGEGHRKTLGVVGRRVPEENIETQRGAARLAKTPSSSISKAPGVKVSSGPYSCIIK